jgi:hypothetical protein
MSRCSKQRGPSIHRCVFVAAAWLAGLTMWGAGALSAQSVGVELGLGARPASWRTQRNRESAWNAGWGLAGSDASVDRPCAPPSDSTSWSN